MGISRMDSGLNRIPTMNSDIHIPEGNRITISQGLLEHIQENDMDMVVDGTVDIIPAQ